MLLPAVFAVDDRCEAQRANGAAVLHWRAVRPGPPALELCPGNRQPAHLVDHVLVLVLAFSGQMVRKRCDRHNLCNIIAEEGLGVKKTKSQHNLQAQFSYLAASRAGVEHGALAPVVQIERVLVPCVIVHAAEHAHRVWVLL